MASQFIQEKHRILQDFQFHLRTICIICILLYFTFIIIHYNPMFYSFQQSMSQNVSVFVVDTFKALCC